MASPTFLLIAGLPPGPMSLTGTELLELQVGSGPGASQQTNAGLIAAIALRQSVQAVIAGAGGVVVDSTNINAPIINIPKAVSGAQIHIDQTNPMSPVISGTVPVAGGIQAAYGTPGGSVLQVGNNVQGIATASYQLTGWAVQCSPAGSLTLDFLTGSLGTAPSSIIGTGNHPQIAGGSSAQSNSLVGWGATTVAAGQVIQVKVTAVATVQWFSVSFFGNRI